MGPPLVKSDTYAEGRRFAIWSIISGSNEANPVSKKGFCSSFNAEDDRLCLIRSVKVMLIQNSMLSNILAENHKKITSLVDKKY